MAIGGKLSDWRHGTNGATSSLTDFTAKMISVEPSFEAEEVDGTTFGSSAYRQFEQSFKEATISATYKYDDTVYGQIAAIYNNGAIVDFQHSPDGTASGKPKDTGAMVLTSFSIAEEVGELLTIETEWRVTAAVTFGTHSA